MKKIIMFPIALFLLTGCMNNEFNSKVNEGKGAIVAEEYERALTSFESALEDTYDKEVEILVSQTGKMIDAISQQKIGNVYKAVGLFEQVKVMENGSYMLSEQAKEKQEKLQQDERDKYDEQLTQAEDLRDNGEYKKAKELLNEIIYRTEVYEYLDEQHMMAKEMFDNMDDEIVEAVQQTSEEE